MDVYCYHHEDSIRGVPGSHLVLQEKFKSPSAEIKLALSQEG